mmetsp:Transcript_48004/g.124475  ORF Transcript_48004/g.124475 Transcript_48004/m.124475 type:complete len:309 (+) Transcript_48004:223-1149(+)
MTVRSSSATQLPEMVSALSYRSVASTSSSREPPHSWIRMRTPKPMSWSFTRNVHRSVDPFATWKAHVCSVRAGTESSSAPCTLMFCHSSFLDSMSSVARAEPLQVSSPRLALAFCMLPRPRSQAEPPAAFADLAFSFANSTPCSVLSDTTLAVSLAYSPIFCTRSDSESSAVFFLTNCTPCCSRSDSETLCCTTCAVVPTFSLILPITPRVQASPASGCAAAPSAGWLPPGPSPATSGATARSSAASCSTVLALPLPKTAVSIRCSANICAKIFVSPDSSLTCCLLFFRFASRSRSPAFETRSWSHHS